MLEKLSELWPLKNPVNWGPHSIVENNRILSSKSDGIRTQFAQHVCTMYSPSVWSKGTNAGKNPMILGLRTQPRPHSIFQVWWYTHTICTTCMYYVQSVSMIKRHKCWKKPNDSRPSNTAKAAFYVPSPSIYAHNVCIYHVCIYIQYMHASMPSARNMPRLEAQKSVGLIFFSPQPRKLSETCSHGI